MLISRSLESKIKSLEGKKQHSRQGDYGLSETGLPLPALDSEATESISRQTSNGENSVGSFTKETSMRASWLSDRQPQAAETETETKPSTSACSERGNDSNIDKFPEVGYEHGVVIRKKRGQRKRKDCSRAAKERSIAESDNLGSSNAVSTANKEKSTNECKRMRIPGSNATRRESLIEIFESVARSGPAAVFRHRMDSQVQQTQYAENIDKVSCEDVLTGDRLKKNCFVFLLPTLLTLLMAETSPIQKGHQAAHGHWHDKIQNHQSIHQISERALQGSAASGKQCARVLLETHTRVQGGNLSQAAGHERLQAALQRALR